MSTRPEIFVDGNEFVVVYPTGWASQCKDRASAQKLVDEYLEQTQEEAPRKVSPVAYAGGTRYHRPVKVLRRSDKLVKTACGQRGWVSENPENLTPCQKCF